MTVEQIDEELRDLHEQVTHLLDKISVLRARREDLIAGTSDHLTGIALAVAALTAKAAEQRLRSKTLAQHPWFVDLRSHPVDHRGQEYAWAPVVRLRADRPVGEYEDVAGQVKAWHLTYSHEAVRSERSHEPGHLRVFLDGRDDEDRQAVAWFDPDGAGAFLLDGADRARRHRVDGDLAEVLRVAAQSYGSN